MTWFVCPSSNSSKDGFYYLYWSYEQQRSKDGLTFRSQFHKNSFIAAKLFLWHYERLQAFAKYLGWWQNVELLKIYSEKYKLHTTQFNIYNCAQQWLWSFETSLIRLFLYGDCRKFFLHFTWCWYAVQLKVWQIIFWCANTNTTIIFKAHILRLRVRIVFMTPCTTNMNTNIILQYYSKICSNIFKYFVMPPFHEKLNFVKRPALT